MLDGSHGPMDREDPKSSTDGDLSGCQAPSSQEPYEASTIIIPLLQVVRLRLEEAKWPVRSHSSSQSHHSTPQREGGLLLTPLIALCLHRKWEGGDPGVAHQKTPTCLLLTPEGAFHSFGYTARDYYHDLDPEEARDWLYFEKFKMKIHSATVSHTLAGSRPAPAREAGPGGEGAGLMWWAKLKDEEGRVEAWLRGGAWKKGWKPG